MVSKKIIENLSGTILFGIAILFVFFGVYKFIEKQDERYDKYSRSAIRLCKEDSSRKLMWDDQLHYWKCM